MLTAHPYLFFKGNCEEAFKLYERVLGGKIVAMLPHKGTPAEEHTPPEWMDKILHARLDIDEGSIMASDAPPGRQQPVQGFSVSLNLTDLADAERIFTDLSEGGSVTMPFGKTFWARGFAMFTDRFGTPWMVNCA